MNLESSGVLHLVPDNPVHAAGLLRSRDYALEERDVCCISSYRTGLAPSGRPPGC